MFQRTVDGDCLEHNHYPGTAVPDSLMTGEPDEPSSDESDIAQSEDSDESDIA